MSNILWIQPNQVLAITTLAIDSVTPEEHAIELQERGDVPSDWIIAGYDVTWPDDNYPHESYRWDGKKIYVDLKIAEEIAAKNAEPTKEELLAQLQALTAKIEAI